MLWRALESVWCLPTNRAGTAEAVACFAVILELDAGILACVFYQESARDAHNVILRRDVIPRTIQAVGTVEDLLSTSTFRRLPGQTIEIQADILRFGISIEPSDHCVKQKNFSFMKIFRSRLRQHLAQVLWLTMYNSTSYFERNTVPYIWSTDYSLLMLRLEELRHTSSIGISCLLISTSN